MSLVYHLPHSKGESPKSSLAAAIWEDGSWYASSPLDGIALIKYLRQRREFAVADYDQTIDLLRNGLERRWTQVEYMATLQAEHDRKNGGTESDKRADHGEVFAVRRAPQSYAWTTLQWPEAKATQSGLDGAVKTLIEDLSKHRTALADQLALWPHEPSDVNVARPCGAEHSEDSVAKNPAPGQ